MRILLVEDEEDLGQAIKQVLVSEKYVVDWVADGAQGWHCLESQWMDYTVAIFDWLLPELSGLSSTAIRSKRVGCRTSAI